MSESTLNLNAVELDETQLAYKWLTLGVLFLVNLLTAGWAGLWVIGAAMSGVLSVLHVVLLVFCSFWALVWFDLLKRT